MKTSLIVFIFFISFSILMTGRALGFYCGSRIVSVGDTKAEVRAKCGEPTSKEERPVGIFATVEEWTYNLGPTEFVRILRFEGGRLAEIETGRYGFTPGSTSDFGCERQIVSIGDTKMEVKAKCGEPTSSDTRIEERFDPVRQHRRVATIDEWTYDLGSSRLIRIYRFENGRLTNIETRGFGGLR